MGFELTEEFTKEHNLSAEQVEAVVKFGNDTITGINDNWKATLEDKITERTNTTFEGATVKIEKESGIKRNEGEIAADYIARVGNTAFSEMKNKASKALEEAEQKLLDASKEGASAEELQRLKGQVDDLQKKEVEYDKLVSDDITGKYQTAKDRISELEQKLAFNNVKPAFSPDVNEYESKAKWEKFIHETKALGDLKEVNNEWVVVSKDNPHDITKLSDLVAKSEEIQGIVKGRQQTGSGTTPVESTVVEGVPFKVPLNAKSSDINQLITQHLTSKGLDPMSKDFSKQYGELYTKIKKQKTA